MRDIRVLDSVTIGRIAAGEVVERPASAAKELIENALDAGATSVTVEIKTGGLELLRVVDNGSGIDEKGAVLAFTRHATSKIRSGDTLVRFGHLGFRGEALPSIAAVADVTLKTRLRGAQEGISVRVEYGQMGEIRPCGLPEGTAIDVRGLFARTPARLKFMKRPSTEAALVAEVVAGMLLLRPDVSFRLIHNGKTVYHSPGDGQLRTGAYVIWGKETASAMIEISGRDGGISVSGLVGVGETAWPNRARQMTFVLGRGVRSAAITQGLEIAARQQVQQGRFPVCILRVDPPDESVDVNVHPNKLEVRFSDEALVRQVVATLVSQALSATVAQPGPPLPMPMQEDAPRPIVDVPPPIEKPSPPEQLRVIMVPARQHIAMRETAAVAMPSRTVCSPPPPKDIIEIPPQTLEERPLPRLIGQALDAFLFLQDADRVLVMDQHAAHERILFERFMKALALGSGSQPLLAPSIANLTPKEASDILAQKTALEAVGYAIEEFGSGALRIDAVPFVLGQPQVATAFLVELAAHAGQWQTGETLAIKRDAIIKLACRKAIKAGDKLDMREALALVADASAETPTCPHGRPIYFVMTRRELDKRFGRIL